MGKNNSLNKRKLPEQCMTAKRLEKKYLTVLIFGILILAGVLFALCRQESGSQEFVAPAFDENALQIENADFNEKNYSILTIAEGYQVGICGKPEEKNGEVVICFSDLPENNTWMKLRILDEENNVMAETGIIRPGEYIEKITLRESLKSSEVPVLMEVLGYEPDTYYSQGKAVLRTKLYHIS